MSVCSPFVCTTKNGKREGKKMFFFCLTCKLLLSSNAVSEEKKIQLCICNRESKKIPLYVEATEFVVDEIER